MLFVPHPIVSVVMKIVRHVNETAFVFSGDESFEASPWKASEYLCCVSDCVLCVIKEWQSSSRKSDSGKHLSKTDFAHELALFSPPFTIKDFTSLEVIVSSDNPETDLELFS